MQDFPAHLLPIAAAGVAHGTLASRANAAFATINREATTEVCMSASLNCVV